MIRRIGTDATSQPLALLVAGTVLLGSIGVLLSHATDLDMGKSATDQGVRQAEVEALADLLVTSPGVGWDAADGTVVRIGLNDGVGQLDGAHLALLRGAAYGENTTNGLVDYEEARQALGLKGLTQTERDFHLRIAPIGLTKAVQDLDLGHIRTAYIGQWQGSPSGTVSDGTDEQVALDARALVDAHAHALAAEERQMLLGLDLDFDDRTHLDADAWDVHVDGTHVTERLESGHLAGDVYPDLKAVLDGSFPARLDAYDLLVVGSGTRHNSLTSDVVKAGIRDWVTQGGTLLVLGSGSQSTQWLQPLFHVGTATINGGAYAADTDHPMLREPRELQWSSYDVPDKAWELKDKGSVATEDEFNHAIVSGDGTLLSVSRPGAFGEGRILLSAYQPGAIATVHGVDEAQGLLHNMIVYMDRSHLYLDYGPTLPTDAVVASTLRLTTLEDSQLGVIPVRVHLFMW